MARPTVTSWAQKLTAQHSAGERQDGHCGHTAVEANQRGYARSDIKPDQIESGTVKNAR